MGNSGFEYDVYISYSRLDNVPLDGDQEGWVTRFHTGLSYVLGMRLGREARIWRDLKFSGDDLIADETAQDLLKTALFISVVSPHYVESEWCIREANEFCKAAENTGGIVINGRSRALKVYKGPVAEEGRLPEVMKNTLGYPMYVVDEQWQGVPIELDPIYGDDFKLKYNIKLTQLAFDVAALITRMENPPPLRSPAPMPAPAAAPMSAMSRSSAEQPTADGSPSIPPAPVPTPAAAPMSAISQGSTEQRKNEKDIFVSYSRKDEAFVLELAKKMKASGVAVWIDQWELAGGDKWGRDIDDALYDLPAFLIVMSPDAFQSDEVRGELQAALYKKKPIFPVSYRPCDRPPHVLLIYQWTDLTDKGLADEAAIQSLAARIRSKLSQKGSVDVTRRARERTKKLPLLRS